MNDHIQPLWRGATRLMRETLHLETTKEDGALARADQNLYAGFAGPLLQPGDFRQIHLGHRIELAEDGFIGAQFLRSYLRTRYISRAT
jgi:hypothetical protein